MNRRSKIIVSVVGIFIVLLALIGITYAYFLTRVEGNTHDTSISITTANLRIVYDDNDSQINATNIQPGDTVYTKTFTVTNEGNETVDYEVYMENVINDFVHHDDLLMFITCKNQDNEDCNGYGSGSVNNGIPTFGTSTYPRVNSKLIENTIEPAPDADSNGEVHTYTLYLQFRDNGDQSDDMGKTLQGKIQIYDPKDIISISGMLTGYEDGYYVQLQSEVKTSELKYEKTVDNVKYYSYIFHGVEPEEESHTLSIMKKGSTTPIVQKSITVTKGNEASVNSDASNIVIDNDTLNIEMNITLAKSEGATSITTTAGEIEKIPYLKDKILADNTVLDGNNLDFSKVNAGLYSTNVNTQDNKTTYFYRGNVDNNYVAFDKENICLISEESFMEVYEYPYENRVKPSTESDCKNTHICHIGGPVVGLSDEECESLGGSTSGETAYWDTKYNYSWRIVRINEDGSIRLIYNDLENLPSDKTIFNIEQDESRVVGYMYGLNLSADANKCITYDATNNIAIDSTSTYNTKDACEDASGVWTTTKIDAAHANVASSTAKIALDNWYRNNILNKYDSIIADAGFCNDRSIELETEEPLASWFGPAARTTPQYKCSDSNDLFTTKTSSIGNKALTYPIGLITIDEARYAGINDTNSNHYLNFQKAYWTLSPRLLMFHFTPEFHYITENGLISYGNIGQETIEKALIPVINIKNVEITDSEQDGTASNPYIIKTN